MTVHHDLDLKSLYQAISQLSDSIDAISCASDLIPSDFGDECSLPIGIMLKRLSQRLHDDLSCVSLSARELEKKVA